MRQKKGFPIWGKLSAKRTDEGKAYVAVIKTGNKANFPLIRRCGATFSLRAKSRLRRLHSDTRLRAQPLGGKAWELQLSLPRQLLKAAILRKKALVGVVRQGRRLGPGLHLFAQMPLQGRQRPAHSAAVETAPAVRVSHSSAQPS